MFGVNDPPELLRVSVKEGWQCRRTEDAFGFRQDESNLFDVARYFSHIPPLRM